MRKLPELSDVAVARTVPFASVNWTCAPGMIAPLVSETVPVTAAIAELEAGVVAASTTACAAGQTRRVARSAVRSKAESP